MKSKITAYVPSSVKDLIKGKKVQDAHVVACDFWVTNHAPLDQPQKKEDGKDLDGTNRARTQRVS